MDEVSWKTDCSEVIVISAEFQKLEIGSYSWKKKIFGLIKDAITRGNVRIKVYTEAHDETVWRMVYDYEGGFHIKLNEKLGRDNIDIIVLSN